MDKSENRKFVLIFSSLLVGQQYFNLVLGDTIPYTDIKVSPGNSGPTILAILVAYFTFQYLLEWKGQPKETRRRMDLVPSIPLAILALAVDSLIAIVFSIRNSDEMKKMGLGRISYVSVALIRTTVYMLLPLSILVLYFLAKYSYALPTPLQNYWLTMFFAPAIIFNAPSFINIIKCLGPSEVRKKAQGRLCCRKAMDLHEMHMQFGAMDVKTHELPPICHAAGTGDITALQTMLNNCASPNEQDPRGWSPLMYAAAEKHTDCVKLLLEHGADPNVINFLGRPALMYAANYGFYEIAELLLKNGATPNISNERTTAPPLFNAAAGGHLETVQLLIEYGADVMAKTNGKTALDAAVRNKHGSVAKYIRKKMLEMDDTPLDEKTDLVRNIKWLDKAKGAVP